MTKVEDTVKKIVTGLRQVASVLTADVDADRINGYAAELAQAIGYVEATPDLIAARELAVKTIKGFQEIPGFGSAIMCVSVDGKHLFTDDHVGAIARIRRGDADTATIVAMPLAGIVEGRRLAEQEANDLRALDMMTAPAARPVSPERLTITVDGPQGSGKTRLANWLMLEFPREVRFSEIHSQRFDPLIIEMREGRPFDVRNDVFVEG